MSPEMKQKWDAHIYQMEKCSFLLDIIRAHVSVIMTMDEHSGSMSDTCIILGGVSHQYCDFILKMREKYPDHDLEMLSMEIYDRIFSRDFKSTARFQVFFETPLNQWYDLREKQHRLFSEKNILDSILSDAKHAYYSVHGKDIEWREIQAESKQLEQEEAEPDEQTQFQRDAERLGEIEEQERRMDLLTELIQNGEITPEIAFKYIHDDSMDFDTFLRVLDIWLERQEGE